MKKITLILTGLISLIPLHAQKILFLHHSTGAGVYTEGNVAAWISNYNSTHSTNFQITEHSYPDSPYDWANYPYDYWKLWLNNGCKTGSSGIECLSTYCSNYKVIIFKHCFPGADILADDATSSVSSSKKTLGNYKLQYRALRTLMDNYPNNKFIVWTLVPEHRLSTNDQDAARAKQFVDWVKNTWLTEDGKQHPNIYIFDFWGYAAETAANPTNGKVNCLKYAYEKSHSDGDSHPNKTANEFIGPKFAEFIVQTTGGQTTGITGKPGNIHPEFFPNPANERIYFSKISENTTCGIYTLTGTKVLEEKIKDNYLDITNLKKGCYLIYLIGEKVSSNGKLMIQ